MSKFKDEYKEWFRHMCVKRGKLQMFFILVGVMSEIDAYTPEPKRTQALERGERTIAILLRL